ncbi:MAG TPA: hypothetical protein VG755_40680 [Nannocystaceae bacterium]|nr:hypothetical protein [Nannocystaceae bacterium]
MGVACWRNLLISCWRESVDVPDVRALFPETEKLLERYPGGVGTMNLIEENTNAPQESREIGGKQIRDLGPRLLCTTNVLLGGGFWVPAARAITSAINLIARRPYPTLITGSIADACQWQAPLLGPVDGEPADGGALSRFATGLVEQFRLK